MERITFDQLPEMVALILEKLERIESLIRKGEKVDEHLGKEILTTVETADFMRVSKSSIYKMSHNRDIPIYKPTGGRIYFKKEDLVAYLQKNRIMSQEELETEAVNHLSKIANKRRAYRIAKK